MVMSRLILAVWWAICASIATAHEFWLEPDSFQVTPGASLSVRLKNGEEFQGTTLSFFPRNIARFDVVTKGAAQPVDGRLGDNPALDAPAPGSGLIVVVHETTPSFVTYKNWAKFQKFADHKDFGDWRTRHAALGYPDPPFRERYTRHAKALIAVGDGAGADAPRGLLTEFVALTNPYAPDFDGAMRVQVLLRGSPRGDVQVEVFDRAPDDSVSITLHRTDADGIATIPVTPGHDYLFDAVVLEPIAAPDKAVWDTFWAALTFGVPAR